MHDVGDWKRQTALPFKRASNLKLSLDLGSFQFHCDDVLEIGIVKNASRLLGH